MFGFEVHLSHITVSKETGGYIHSSGMFDNRSLPKPNNFDSGSGGSKKCFKKLQSKTKQNKKN